ncbi:TolC family outer membrane protein [Salinivibrio costicola]|uniref:TolC family outer membrane protein n=1 Tax=Salinivibrio costicola TaxID=51367 RepID=A0ABX6K5Q4_SALCS|nr:TolC family outer membrane protein [Salinivibrio costicola]QIR06867.1 TolC family outer membrane protein [Salinivibrio costicola]
MLHLPHVVFKKRVTAIALMLGLSSPAVLSQTLEQAVAQSLESHPQIRQAFARYKASEQAIDQAKAGYYPKLDATAGIGWERTDSPATRRDTTTDDEVDLTRRELGVSLQQMLFDGFRTQNEVARTQNEATAEQWAMIATAEDKALEVSRVYLDVLIAEQVVTLAEKNLQNHQEIYDAIAESNAGGFAKASDLSQVTGRLARANANLMSARNNLADAQSRFTKMVGESPEALRLPMPDAELLPRTLEAMLDIALEQHPRIHAAQSDIAAANAARDGSRAAYLPTLNVEVAANWNENVGGEDGAGPPDVGPENNNVQAMLRMRYNLFNGGADRARERQTAYQTIEAREINEMTHRDVIEGATLAWNARTYLEQQRDFMRQHVEAATDTRDAYREEFRLNARTLLDVLDSQNELFEARREYLSKEADELYAQYRILNATGRLLASLRVDTPAIWNTASLKQEDSQ